MSALEHTVATTMWHHHLYQIVNTYTYPLPAWFAALIVVGRCIDYWKHKSVTSSVLYIMTMIANYSLFFAVYKDESMQEEMRSTTQQVPKDLLVLVIWTPAITVHAFYWLHNLIASFTSYLLVFCLSTVVNTNPFVYLVLFHKGYVQQSYVLWVAAFLVLVMNRSLEQVWNFIKFNRDRQGLTPEQSHQLRMIYLVASRLQHLSRRNPVLDISSMNMFQLEKTRQEYEEKLEDIDCVRSKII